jgi:ABC-2 type transport system ATP-binding protein
MPIVQLQDVSKAYDSKVAVDQLSFEIAQGSMFGLLGPNGSGKTSSIRMMIGMTMPDSGSVSLFDQPFDRKSVYRVGYLPEERAFTRR